MPLIESQSFTNQNIASGKSITFAAAPANYDSASLRVFLYELSAASSTKAFSMFITKAGSGVESRFPIVPSFTTTVSSVVLLSDPFPLSIGDVIRINIVGGAGDSANPDIIAQLWGIPDLSALITTVDGVVNAIKAKTDNLIANPADESLLEAYISSETAGLATSAALGMVSSVVNTLPSAAEIDAQLSGTHGAGTWGNATGGGAVLETVTVTVSGLPRDGVEVWVTTDEAGLNLVANGVTDALGQVDFMLDPGTYYVWKQLAGVNFTNPQTTVVS